MRKERIGKIGYRICAVLAAAVSLWCMGDNLWPVVKENGRGVGRLGRRAYRRQQAKKRRKRKHRLRPKRRP